MASTRRMVERDLIEPAQIFTPTTNEVTLMSRHADDNTLYDVTMIAALVDIEPTPQLRDPLDRIEVRRFGSLEKLERAWRRDLRHEDPGEGSETFGHEVARQYLIDEHSDLDYVCTVVERECVSMPALSDYLHGLAHLRIDRLADAEIERLEFSTEVP